MYSVCICICICVFVCVCVHTHCYMHAGVFMCVYNLSSRQVGKDRFCCTSQNKSKQKAPYHPRALYMVQVCGGFKDRALNDAILVRRMYVCSHSVSQSSQVARGRGGVRVNLACFCPSEMVVCTSNGIWVLQRKTFQDRIMVCESSHSIHENAGVGNVPYVVICASFRSMFRCDCLK